MSWQNLLNILLFVVIFKIVFHLIDRASLKKKGIQEGVGTLKMHPAYTYFGLFLLAVGFMFLFTAIGNMGEDQAWAVALIGAVSLVFGFYVLAFGRSHQVTFSEKEVTIRNWRGQTIRFDWSEIKSIHYARTKGKFQFQLENKTVGCHFHLKGITNFLRFAQDKTKLEVQF